MIVPRSRLTLFTAVVLLPFAALAGALPEHAAVAGMFLGAFLIAVLADAALALGRLDGVAATLPEVVRLTKDREGTIEIRITNERLRLRRVCLAPALPREFTCPRETMEALLPPDTVHSTVPWPCTPGKRGRFLLDAVYLEAASPVGFWAVRKCCRIRSEARVYPNLFEDRKHLAALFLNRGAFGIHAQRQVGKGREFEKLRDYIPGDSFDDIHWKATAKRGRPVSKVFQIERTQEIYVVVDASRLSARLPGGERVPLRDEPPGTTVSAPPDYIERFITAGLLLGAAAEQQGDRFGLVAFDDRIRRFVRASGGKSHYGTCRDALYTLEARIVNPDYEELCTFIRLRLRRRALLVILTSLDDPVLAESFVRNADLISRHHLVLVNMIQPPRTRPLFSDEGVERTDGVYRALAGHIQWHDLRELERVLHRRGVTLSLLDNAKMCVQLVAQYIGVKQRQLL